MAMHETQLGRIKQLFARLWRTERMLLVVLLVVALAIWAFIEIADEVVEGEANEFDRRILLALRTPEDVADPIGPRWFEDFVRDMTAIGSLGVIVLVVGSACSYLWLQGKRSAVVYLLIAVIGGQLISSGLKTLFDRPRPDLVPHGAYVYTQSFPSGHSMMSAVTYMTLGALLARYQPTQRLRIFVVSLGIIIALIVGLSRIYLSVHWPTDVLAGWAAGAAWALVCWMVASYSKVMDRDELGIRN